MELGRSIPASMTWKIKIPTSRKSYGTGGRNPTFFTHRNHRIRETFSPKKRPKFCRLSFPTNALAVGDPESWKLNSARFFQSLKAWQRPGLPSSPQDPMVDWYTRWWFQLFLFSPLPGEMIQFDEHIFQMGWFQPPTSIVYVPSWKPIL